MRFSIILKPDKNLERIDLSGSKLLGDLTPIGVLGKSGGVPCSGVR